MPITPSRRTAAAGAAALSLGLLLPAAPAAAAAPPGAGATSRAAAPAASVQSARYGAGWLARLIAAAGGHIPRDPAKPGSSAADPGNTADAIVALHAARVGRAESAAAMHWLQRHYAGYVHVGSGDSPGALAKVILAARASGVSPTSFGSGTKTDLVARLLRTQRTGGRDAGLFGAQNPTYDGAYRQGLSLLALRSVGRSNAAGARWLKRQQCGSGGWLGYRADLTRPCPAPNPASFSGPDSNSTSLAIQGLRVSGVRPAHDALGFLAAVQGRDGGWAFVPGRSAHSDPNSTAVVIQAILRSGSNPAGGRWVRGGHSPYGALDRFQLGCSVPRGKRGAYWFPYGDGTRKPNVFATVQAVPAAAGRTLPLKPSTPSAAVPAPAC